MSSMSAAVGVSPLFTTTRMQPTQGLPSPREQVPETRDTTGDQSVDASGRAAFANLPIPAQQMAQPAAKSSEEGGSNLLNQLRAQLVTTPAEVTRISQSQPLSGLIPPEQHLFKEPTQEQVPVQEPTPVQTAHRPIASSQVAQYAAIYNSTAEAYSRTSPEPLAPQQPALGVGASRP